MPITPFHLGPALVLKAASGKRFSLMVFGFSQVAIDVEPLVALLSGRAVLHGFTHTFVGATLIAVASVVVGRPICERLLAYWHEAPVRISKPAAYAGAFVGTYSHIFLDGMMHLDMRPLAPFSDTNPMLGAMSIPAIYVLCFVTGVVGALACLRRASPDGNG